MGSWAELLRRPEPGEHIVQLYGRDDRLLARNVSRYLAEGLRDLDGLVVIATPEHADGIARHLAEAGAGATIDAERTGRLVFLDARATLERIFRNGQLDQGRFEAVVVDLLRQVRSSARTAISSPSRPPFSPAVAPPAEASAPRPVRRLRTHPGGGAFRVPSQGGSHARSVRVAHQSRRGGPGAHCLPERQARLRPSHR